LTCAFIHDVPMGHRHGSAALNTVHVEHAGALHGVGEPAQLVQEPAALVDQTLLRREDRLVLRLVGLLHALPHRPLHRRRSLLPLRSLHVGVVPQQSEVRRKRWTVNKGKLFPSFLPVACDMYSLEIPIPLPKKVSNSKFIPCVIWKWFRMRERMSEWGPIGTK